MKTNGKSITEVLIKETKMTGIGNCKDLPTLQIRSNHKIYILNSTLQEWSSNMGFVAGFGKGIFKLVKADGSDLPEKAIEFKYTNSLDHVVFNGVVVTLGKVVNEQKAKNPAITVCYHSLTIDDADPKKFECTQTHKVTFIPKDDQAEKDITINTIACKEELKYWSTDVVQLMWIVRWTAKGLMPVKPVIHLKGQLTVPAGRACLL